MGGNNVRDIGRNSGRNSGSMLGGLVGDIWGGGMVGGILGDIWVDSFLVYPCPNQRTGDTQRNQNPRGKSDRANQWGTRNH